MSQEVENRSSLQSLGADRAQRLSRYPEISASSIIFGIIFGALMNAAVTYAGLKIGFTLGGSAIAAVRSGTPRFNRAPRT